MKKNILFLLILTTINSVFGMIQPEDNFVKIESSDGKIYVIPQQLAMQSDFLKGLLEDIPKDKNIISVPFQKDILDLLFLKLMPMFIKNSNDIKEAAESLSSRLDLYSIENLAHLSRSTDYFDMPGVENAFAYYIVGCLYQQNQDRDAIEQSVKTFSQLIQPLLVKYWYLRYGNDRDFVLPELDYGFSVKELHECGKLPEIKENWAGNKVLNLSQCRISDLTGLSTIPRHDEIQVLKLYGNQISELHPGVFNGFNNLQWLSLSKNHLRKLQPVVFNGLTKLELLDFAGNQLNLQQYGRFKRLIGCDFSISIDKSKLSFFQPSIWNWPVMLPLNWLFINRPLSDEKYKILSKIKRFSPNVSVFF